jgi:hypothetical protein
MSISLSIAFRELKQFKLYAIIHFYANAYLQSFTVVTWELKLRIMKVRFVMYIGTHYYKSKGSYLKYKNYNALPRNLTLFLLRKIGFQLYLFYVVSVLFNSIQFFIIYVPGQQLQGQLQTQHSVGTDNNIMSKTQHKIKV